MKKIESQNKNDQEDASFMISRHETTGFRRRLRPTNERHCICRANTQKSGSSSPQRVCLTEVT